MSKSLFLACLILAAIPAWADEDIKTLEAKIERQQQKIDALERRLEKDEDINLGVHTQIMNMIQAQKQPTGSTISVVPQETPSQAWDRIHAEGQQQKMQGDIDAQQGRENDRTLGIQP